jgi:hypothetical protein
MKKTILISAVVLIGSLLWGAKAAAQMTGENGPSVTETVVTEQKRDYDKNAWPVEIGIGTGFNLGFGWLHNYSRYFGWDVINLNYTKHFVYDGINLSQFMSGVRVFVPFTTNPRNGLFASARFGYGVGRYPDDEYDDPEIGTCYEFALGIAFLGGPMSLAFVYNLQNGSSHEYYSDFYGYSYTSGAEALHSFVLRWGIAL